VATAAELTPGARRSQRRNILDAERARALYSVLDDGRFGPMFALALTTGLRPGDAVYVQALEDPEGAVLIVPAATAAEWFEMGRQQSREEA